MPSFPLIKFKHFYKTLLIWISFHVLNRRTIYSIMATLIREFWMFIYASFSSTLPTYNIVSTLHISNKDQKTKKNMDLRKVMLAIAFIGMVSIPLIIWFYFDFTDFSWAANSSSYLYLIVSVCLIISGIGSYIQSGKPEKPKK